MLQIVSDLNNKLNEKGVVLGPITPYIPYQNDTHVRECLIKFRQNEPKYEALKSIIRVISNKSGLGIEVNIDPYDF